MIKNFNNINEDELKFLKDIVNKLNAEEYIDECYEVDSENIIFGVSLRVDDISLFLTNECLYVEDANSGDTLNLDFNADYNVYQILSELMNNGIAIKFRDVKVSCFGEFFKPDMDSKFTKIDKEVDADVDMLCYLLEFLQNKGTLNLTCDYTDGLTEILEEWNKLPKV